MIHIIKWSWISFFLPSSDQKIKIKRRKRRKNMKTSKRLKKWKGSERMEIKKKSATWIILRFGFWEYECAPKRMDLKKIKNVLKGCYQCKRMIKIILLIRIITIKSHALVRASDIRILRKITKKDSHIAPSYRIQVQIRKMVTEETYTRTQNHECNPQRSVCDYRAMHTWRRMEYSISFHHRLFPIPTWIPNCFRGRKP